MVPSNTTGWNYFLVLLLYMSDNRHLWHSDFSIQTASSSFSPLLYVSSEVQGNTDNRPPTTPFCMWLHHVCTLTELHAWVLTLLLLLYQILTLYSLLLFSFLFHSFSSHHTAPHPTTPVLHLTRLTSFPFSLTLFQPTFPLSMVTPLFYLTCPLHLFLFSTSTTSSPASSLLVSPAIGFLSPLVSRGERQWVPAHSSDQSRAAGLPSHCW